MSQNTSQRSRINIFIPEDLLAKIREVAANKFNAPINAISKQPETSPTVIKLLEIGLKALDDGYTDTHSTDIDINFVEKKVDELVNTHLDAHLANFLTKEEAVTMSQLDHRAASIVERIESLEKKLADFDKGFQGLGSSVHDHDKILSQPIATKEDLQKAIANLKNEIESQLTEKSSLQNDLESVSETKKVVTQAKDASERLDPISNDGLSIDALAKQLGMTRQAIESRRNNGALEQLGYTAKKEGKRWKYYKN